MWSIEEAKKIAIKCNTLKELKAASSSLFCWVRYHKNIDEVMPHRIKPPRTANLSPAELTKRARKFKTRYTFQLGDSSAYQAAKKKNLLDVVCKHMRPLPVEWTKAKVLKEAKKYKFLRDFRKQSGTAYKWALEWGLMSQLKKKMIVLKHSRTKKQIFEEIRRKQYKSFSELYNDNPGLHQMVVKNPNWKKEAGKFLYARGTSTGEETVRHFLGLIFGRKFIKSRPQWLVNNKTGSRMELDGFCSSLGLAFEYQGVHHFKQVYKGADLVDVKFKDQLKKKLCVQNGVKLIIIKDVNLNKPINRANLKSSIRRELVRLGIGVPVKFDATKVLIKGGLQQWSESNLKQEALKFKILSDFRIKASSAYNAAANMEILESITSHMKRGYLVWTPQRALKVARKFRSVADLRKNNSGCCVFLRRNNLLQEVFPDFIPTSLIAWSKAKAFKEARKYNYRYQFQTSSTSAYLWLVDNKMLDDACRHMKSKNKV